MPAVHILLIFSGKFSGSICTSAPRTAVFRSAKKLLMPSLSLCPLSPCIKHLFHQPPYRCFSHNIGQGFLEEIYQLLPLCRLPINFFFFENILVEVYPHSASRTVVFRHTRFLFIDFSSDVAPYHWPSLSLPTL